MATTKDAIAICRLMENITPEFGCHVALTGGTLYKDGDRKDIDILLYRIRQVNSIDMDGLFNALEDKLGLIKESGFGWVYKAHFMGFNLDLFFPEEQGGEYYPRSDESETSKRSELAETTVCPECFDASGECPCRVPF